MALLGLIRGAAMFACLVLRTSAFEALARSLKTQTLLLNDGTEMPVIGLGTWRSKPLEVENAVYHAICNAGYRMIDAAQIYGNQDEVGRALRRAMETESCSVKRSDLWITSKIWNVDFHPDHVLLAVDRILRELGLDYVDQMLLHWPVPYKKPPLGCPPDCPEEFASTDDPMRPRGPDGGLVHSEVSLADTWKALESAKAMGKIRSIGVSNFNIDEIRSLSVTPGSTVPAVNQVEAHVFWRQSSLRQSMRDLGINMVAYSPLGNPEVHGAKSGLSSASINSIAAETGLTPAQVMLSFLLDQGIIVIPKSVTPARIDSNIDFVPNLTAHQIAMLLQDAPQARLGNPKNRPGGKPVFADDVRAEL